MKESFEKYKITKIQPFVGETKHIHKCLLGCTVQTRLLEIGKPWVAYAEEYGTFHTSTVTDIIEKDNKLYIETANTKYFLEK